LRMVWRGETIVVNKLFADYNRERRETRTSRTVKFDVYEMESSEMQLERNTSRNEDDDSSEESSIVLVFGGSTAALRDFSDDEEEELPPIAEASLTEEQLERILLEQNDDANSETVRQRPTLNMAFPRTKPTNHAFMRSRRIVVSGERSCSEPCVPATNAESQRTRMFAAAFESVRSFATAPTAMGRQQSMQKFEIDYNPKVQDKIVISETEPPSRRLLLRMIDAQRLLAQANRTVLAGSTVSKEDWDEIRRVAVELGGVFQEDVEFQWESNDSNLIQRHPSPATSSQKGTRHALGSSSNSG
jgi:predicted nucleic acid-binding Zn ribbon protein